MLDLRVLDHSFDDQIDVTEVAVRQRRTNAVEHFSHLRSGHATLVNAADQQLGGFGQTLLDTVLVDVLHQNRRAFGGRLIGDTATHDAGAQYGSLLHVFGDFVVGLGLFLQFLIVQEQADQALRSRGLGQFDEACSFHFQRFVATEVRGFLDGLDRLNRRRVVRAGLASHETFGGFESHHLFNGVQLEFFKFRLTLGLVIELAGDGALDQLEGSFLQFFRGDYGVDGADFQRVFRAVFLAGGNPLDGVVDTDQAWQTHGTAEARVDAQFDFRQTNLGLGGHDAIVSRQAHFQTATEGDAVDGRDGWHVEVFEIAEDLVGFEIASNQLGIRQLEVVDKFGDVGADDEHVLAAADDHALDRSICLDGVYGLTQFVQG